MLYHVAVCKKRPLWHWPVIFTFGLILLLARQNIYAEDSPGRTVRENTQEKPRPWTELEPGLEYAEFILDDNGAKITVLRIDPDYFDFVLGASGLVGGDPRSLSQWASELNLKAAINASMYLPDNKTSTGYMRQGEYSNNSRIVNRFGAFFVADPRKPGLVRARIVDRDEQGWREILNDYNLIIQNYRMTNAQRKILWSPGGPLYSISAIAQDGTGKILFLHTRKPMEAYSFVQNVLHLPLDVRTIMYVEGGAQAGLLINSSNLRRELVTPHAPSFLVTGNLKAVLPNILGIRSKKTSDKAGSTEHFGYSVKSSGEKP